MPPGKALQKKNSSEFNLERFPALVIVKLRLIPVQLSLYNEECFCLSASFLEQKTLFRFGFRAPFHTALIFLHWQITSLLETESILIWTLGKKLMALFDTLTILYVQSNLLRSTLRLMWISTAVIFYDFKWFTRVKYLNKGQILLCTSCVCWSRGMCFVLQQLQGCH